MFAEPIRVLTQPLPMGCVAVPDCDSEPVEVGVEGVLSLLPSGIKTVQLLAVHHFQLTAYPFPSRARNGLSQCDRSRRREVVKEVVGANLEQLDGSPQAVEAPLTEALESEAVRE